MREITVHTTVEITKIVPVEDEMVAEKERAYADIPERLTKFIKAETNADDVQVTSHKIFIGAGK